MSKRANLINTLRLTEEQRRELLARLDQAAVPPKLGDKRRAERTAAPEQAVLLWWREPVGRDESALFQATCRNISDTGIAFLHRSYVHPGTACVFVLKVPGHEGLRIAATIVHCRYVKAGVYEVGARFSEPIDLRGLLSASPDGENG